MKSETKIQKPERERETYKNDRARSSLNLLLLLIFGKAERQKATKMFPESKPNMNRIGYENHENSSRIIDTSRCVDVESKVWTKCIDQ